MLRSFRENAFDIAWRWPEPEALRGMMVFLARFLATAAGAWCLSRATLAELQPTARLAPFAMALFAAGLAEGLNAAALLAGCMLGAIYGRIDVYNLSLPIGCGVILAGSLLWDLVSPWLARQRRKPDAGVVAATLAGLGVLAPGLIYAGGQPWPSAQALAASLAALAAAPFVRAGLRVRWHSRALLIEERAGLLLMFSALAAGVYGACPPLALGLSMLAMALACPAGAMIGLGAGGALLLTRGDVRVAALLGLCGGAAELGRRLPRLPRAGVTSGTALALALYMGLPAPETAALCLAPPLAAVAPGWLRTRARHWARSPSAACDPDRLAGILRGQTVKRLRALGTAFEDLAEGYLQPTTLPDEQALMGRLRERLCAECPGYEACWTGGDNHGARLLCELVGQAIQWSRTDMAEGLFEDGVGADLARRCRRSRQLPERVGELLEDFVRQRLAGLRRGGENRLISAQFLQAAQIIGELADEQARPVHLRDRQARRVMGILERENLPLSDALLVSGQRTELILTLREGRWTRAMAGTAAEKLERAFGRVYAPQDAMGRTLRLVRLPRLMAEVGAGSVSRDPGAPSGDSCATAELTDERLLALICDGMGSGAAAAKESASAARSLGHLLAAGAALPLAVETVNALMVNTSVEDMFSTVDLMLLDLATGVADFVKLAACPALIAREGAVRRVEGGRLPLGILERVEPAVTRVQLMEGDVVLLASDGVMDAADPEALEALLLSGETDMNALSERILDLAGQCAGGHRDDMTAICLRIMERKFN